MHNACSYGHYEVTELLVKHGASVNVCDLWRFTPLHEGSAKGKYEIGKRDKIVFSNHQITLRSFFKNIVKWQQDLKISSNGNNIFNNLVKRQQDF